MTHQSDAMRRERRVIPYPTRLESAVRVSTVYLPEPGKLWQSTGELPDWQPTGLLWACVCAAAFIVGWLAASMGVPLPW